jgi:hypothetical protein
VNLERVEKIAEAVLYEGYMLYPYRPSSVKNQQRWNFGVLCPRCYSELQQGTEAWMMQTECLIKTTALTRLSVKVRFLQIVQRSIGKLRVLGQEQPESVEPELDIVDCLEVGGRTFRPWQEAVEREHTIDGLNPELLSSLAPLHLPFLPGKQFEYLRDEDGKPVGVIVREWQSLVASIQFDSIPYGDGVIKASVRVQNLSSFTTLDSGDRDDALAFSLVSAHTILAVEQGEFVSLLDPPSNLKDVATLCQNVGTWPVLVGDRAETMLSSPIILYDHPQIAPESAGDLFDATEIDEILSLRILTLTDDEKREVRESDDRARKILDRTENMPEEQFMKLHGALRGLNPIKEEAR